MALSLKFTILLAITFATILLIPQLVYSQATQSYPIRIDVDGYGVGVVYQIMRIDNVELVPALGKLLYLKSINDSNVAYYIENNTIILVPPNGYNSTVEFSYVSQLATPSGQNWNLTLQTNANASILLPYGAIPLSMMPLPIDFNISNDGRLNLFFTPGNLSIIYSLAPSTTTSPSSIQTTTSPSTVTTQPTGQQQSNLVTILLGVIALAVIAIALLFFRKKK